MLYNPSIFFGKGTQLLYVYTADFSNVGDVTRVLREMKKLRLWRNNRRAPIHYTPGKPTTSPPFPGFLDGSAKLFLHGNAIADRTPDAFAYLKIESGNEWGIDELLYRSDQLIPPKSRKN
jgi:hypothetical protein